MSRCKWKYPTDRNMWLSVLCFKITLKWSGWNKLTYVYKEVCGALVWSFYCCELLAARRGEMKQTIHRLSYNLSINWPQSFRLLSNQDLIYVKHNLNTNRKSGSLRQKYICSQWTKTGLNDKPKKCLHKTRHSLICWNKNTFHSQSANFLVWRSPTRIPYTTIKRKHLRVQRHCIFHVGGSNSSDLLICLCQDSFHLSPAATHCKKGGVG